MDSFNRWLDRFCYRHPNFGVRNLMRYIVILNVVFFLLCKVDVYGTFTQYLVFAPQLILRGQIWRLVTYVFIPSESRIIFFAIMQYFYYFIGSNLEAEWGSAKLCVYYLLSVLITAVLGVIAYVFTRSPFLSLANARYINLSLFFAFATMYPDARVLLFFFIPVKMKWLGYASALYNLFCVFYYAKLFPYNLLPIFALAAYFLFFGATLVNQLRLRLGKPPIMRRSSDNVVNFRRAQRSAKKEADRVKKLPYTRKCAVCGKTDAEFPDLEFRYCSKCAGYHCFCSEHINSHIHFTE